MIDIKNISTHCTRSEFVGTAVLDTIGLVISGIDDTLLETMNVGMKYRCLGLFSSRTGAAGQITAIDDAVKATNTEVLSIELPRDTKGWGGHGNYIVLGGTDVSDVRHAISIALELTNKYAGELYISESGHLEFAYSASAGQALNKSIRSTGWRSLWVYGGFSGCNRACDGRYCDEISASFHCEIYDAE